jgi:hypothetical protein
VVDNTQTRAHAWYEAGWDLNGISIGINPSGVSGGLSFSRSKRGEVEKSARFNTYFTCPPEDDGGGGGYEGGDDCIVCQQWFLPVNEDWTFEWWECSPGAPTECSGGWET